MAFSCSIYSEVTKRANYFHLSEDFVSDAGAVYHTLFYIC